MPRKSAAATEAELIEEVEHPKTRGVKVSSVTRREYVEEEPIEELAFQEDDEPLDPFALFNELISSNQQARLRVWRLPNFDSDGRFGTTNTEREYCATLDYDPNNNANVLEQIQVRVPQGGTLQLELIVDGRITKRGLLKIIKQQIPGGYAPPSGYPPIMINSPMSPLPVSTNPVETLRDQLSFAKDLVGMAKDLVPQQPTQEVVEQANLKDRVLEGILVHAFKGDSVPADRFDKVIDALAGGKQEPSWVELVIQGLGPQLGTVAVNISNSLSLIVQRFVTGKPMEGQAVTESTPNGASAPGNEPPAQIADPAQRAWMRVLGRVLDDLFEHVEAVNQGRKGIEPGSSAEAIVDLAERFEHHEQITGIVTGLVDPTTTPEQVIDLCATMVPAQIQAKLLELKGQGVTINWVRALQDAVRDILQGEGDETDENERGSGANGKE